MKNAKDVVAMDLDYISRNLDGEFNSIAGSNMLITGGAGFDQRRCRYPQDIAQFVDLACQGAHAIFGVVIISSQILLYRLFYIFLPP